MPQTSYPGLSIEVLEQRVSQVKQALWYKDKEGKFTPWNVDGSVSSTLTILALVYGNPSPQLEHFQKQIPRGLSSHDHGGNYAFRIANAIGGILDAALADFRAGLTKSVRLQAQGEVLGDFVALARESLDARSEPTERVAAVLAAAALEETLKRLGATQGVDVYSRDLRGVIQKLKDADVLVGAQAGTASGFVKFRDHAFHGQFELVERSSTAAVLAFVEELLVRKMS